MVGTRDLAALSCVLALVAPIGQDNPQASDDPHAGAWRHHGGDEGGSKYSSLDQINRDNVDNLVLAWSYRTGDGAGRMRPGGSYGLQATPILVAYPGGSALVLCGAFGQIIALDPATGAERWSFDPGIPREVMGIQYKCRGVAQWHDRQADSAAACTARIFAATADQRLIALDAETGAPCAGFGRDGVVDLVPYIEATAPATDTPGVRTYMPPAVVGDIVVLGSVVGAKFSRADAPSGAVRAFDARNGTLKWSFDPVPRNPGDPQARSWSAESLAMTGGANVWTLMSTDTWRDLVFLPTSSASPNFFGGTRPGPNPYANSTVALRGSTGELVWHYQIIHHDVWDWDLASQPMAVTLSRDGRALPAVVQLTKHGFVFVFNRDTGEPVFPVEERAVPTDGVPGEWLSPTQPFPTAPPPLAPTHIDPDDAWGFTVFDRNACRRLIESLRHGEMFTPPSTQGTIMMPGMANNWGGGAFDPKRQLLITNVQRIPGYVRLIPRDQIDPDAADSPMAGIPGGPAGYIDGTPYALERGPFRVLSPLRAPCTSPPWYTLTAVDLARGEVAWSVPLGTIEKLLRLPLPLKLGAPGIGGPIITAGGLIFIGATADERLRAFDIDTGVELWSAVLPTAAMATPMTYQLDGRQFVVVAAGGHHAYYRQKVGDHLLAFALTEKSSL
jgi:quinoprotein glucose dehydrogenase